MPSGGLLLGGSWSSPLCLILLGLVDCEGGTSLICYLFSSATTGRHCLVHMPAELTPNYQVPAQERSRPRVVSRPEPTRRAKAPGHVCSFTLESSIATKKLTRNRTCLRRLLAFNIMQANVSLTSVAGATRLLALTRRETCPPLVLGGTRLSPGDAKTRNQRPRSKSIARF